MIKKPFLFRDGFFYVAVDWFFVPRYLRCLMPPNLDLPSIFRTFAILK